MAQAGKILGQAAPAATTETLLYTVPAATWTVVSSVVVCNRGAANAKFRVSVSAAGGATANKDYQYYDETVPANDSFAVTLGITLGATDVIRVYTDTATVSFSAFGVENS